MTNDEKLCVAILVAFLLGMLLGFNMGGTEPDTCTLKRAAATEGGVK